MVSFPGLGIDRLPHSFSLWRSDFKQGLWIVEINHQDFSWKGGKLPGHKNATASEFEFVSGVEGGSTSPE